MRVNIELTFRGTEGLRVGREMLAELTHSLQSLENWKNGVGEFEKHEFTEGCGVSITVPEGVRVLVESDRFF